LTDRTHRKKPRRAARAGAGGFTLLEIVVALAVIGGVMFILLETHFRALRLYESARDEVTIRNFLSQAMGRAETEVLAGNLAGDGTFGKRYPDYSYTFEAQQMGEGYVLLYDVLVTVKTPQEQKHEIVFMVYDPRSTGGAATSGTRPGAVGPGSIPGSIPGIDLGRLSQRLGSAAAGSGR
jgi:prepilin-type N-terminal cleavage/methylation domain-containing protein